MSLRQQILSVPDFVDWGQPVNWAHPLNRGLVSWWLAVPGRMGYGSMAWRDLCGRNNGTLTSFTAGGSHWGGAKGRKGGWGSISFRGSADGFDEYIAVGSVPALNSITDISFAGWFKFGSVSALQWLFKKYGGGSGPGLWFWPSGAGKINWDYNSSMLSVDAPLSTGVWYHIAGVTKSGVGREVFIDGISVGTDGTAPSTGTEDVNLCGPVGSGVNSLEGLANSLRIYSRALSAAEVTDLYRRESNYYDGLLNRFDPMLLTQQAAGFSAFWASQRSRLIGGGV